MINWLKKYGWLIVVVVLLNITARFLPDDFLYPVGRFYASIAAKCSGIVAEMFSKASQRFLFPGYAYYFADALCWLLVALYTLGTATRYARIVCLVFVGVALNNFLDELIFNPYKFSWNELFVGVFFLWRAWVEYTDIKRAQS